MSGVQPVVGGGPSIDPGAGDQAPGLLRRSWGNGRTKVGVAITLLVVAVAVIGPFVAPESETGFVGPPNTADVAGTLFGTDALGRDVWSRFLHGGLSVLWLSALCTIVGVGVGLLIALLAGYSRTWVDELLMRTTDVFLAFPAIVLALLFLAIFQPQPWTVIVTVAAGHAPRVALTAQPWPVLLPVIAIGLLTVGTNLVADGIARAAAGTDREVIG